MFMCFFLQCLEKHSATFHNLSNVDDRVNFTCRDAGERLHDGVIPPCPFIREAKRADVPIYKSTISNLMVYQDRNETNLLQLFAHPETSECFSIISGVIFDVNIVVEQKQA